MKKILLGLCALIAVLVIGVVIAVLTVDPNRYKGQIVAMLEKQTGRSVRLDGPLKLGLSWDGVTLSVNKAAIGNPSWASRPEMASIDELDLGIALLPLLDKKVIITGFKIDKADIEIETSRNNQSNLDMQPVSGAQPVTAPPAKAAASAQAPAQSSATPVAIGIDHVSVKDSRLAVRDKDGKTSVYKLDSFSLDREGSGMALRFAGSSDNVPVTLNVKMGATDLLADKVWPFSAEAAYADYKLTGDGKIDLNKKSLHLADYKLVSGKTSLHGALAATWGGAKPTAQGSLESDAVDLADFKPPAGNESKTSAAPAPAEGNGQPARVFSDAPLSLQGLKSADANFDVKLGEVTSGKATLKNVAGKITLASGRLTVDFPKVQLGNSAMSLKATVDGAAAPAHAEVSFVAPSVDLTDLLALADMKDFMSGKANATFSVTSTGDSMHELASHANGSLVVISDGGQISANALQGIYAGLAQLVSGGSGNGSIGLNCLAARFNIKDGVMADNGILADTTATTVKGSGGVNLGSETTDMQISSKPKLGGKYGGLVPPVHIGGTLLKPSYKIAAGSVVQNVAGLVMGGQITSDVPSIQTQPGQNACVYTLDHPQAAAKSAAKSPTSALAGKATDQVNKLLGGKLKGLFGQ